MTWKAKYPYRRRPATSSCGSDTDAISTMKQTVVNSQIAVLCWSSLPLCLVGRYAPEFSNMGLNGGRSQHRPRTMVTDSQHKFNVKFLLAQ